MANRIIRFFPDSDLRGGHDWLARAAKEHGVSVNSIVKGEHIVFMNKKQNMVKIYSAGNVLIFFKTRDGRAMDLNAIQFIPECLSGGRFHYDKAMMKVFAQHFKKTDERRAA